MLAIVLCVIGYLLVCPRLKLDRLKDFYLEKSEYQELRAREALTVWGQADSLGGNPDHLVQTDASVGELAQQECQQVGPVEHHNRQFPNPSSKYVGMERVGGLVLERPWIPCFQA